MGCRLKEWGVDYHFFSYVLGWCIPFLFVLFVLCLLPVGSLPGRNDLVAYSYMARGIFSSPLWFFLATWYVSVHFFRIAFLFPFSFSFFPSLYSFSFSLSFFCLCFLFLISRRSICPRSRRTSLPGAFTRSIYLFTPEYKYLLEYQVFIFRSSLLLSSSTRIVYLLITSNWW